MCNAIPIAAVLLLLLVAGTLCRCLRPSSPNAELLATLLDEPEPAEGKSGRQHNAETTVRQSPATA
ncbi:hypothetical protein GM415_05535 [Pseudodesulfovibrio cashew]|uniref:Uncharacterized protein n=1 Tax=Pseudodesulfovibrio cashew TaxID=2678688 RepID=A0A6I6JBY1_9BACT|nr:hypothetical protein [Pseudodesulfovibrio cashew]QGY39601.1 hypothetical protein GM415_05535 [Pseudodesulfovibrio cashew]